MGYRSDVAYVIRFGTTDQRDAFVELVKHRNEKNWAQAIEECEVQYAEPIITFEVQDVKWYADFEDVKSHHAILDWAVELYPDAGYRIIMVGEDGQEECNQGGECDDLWDYLYTSHSLHTEFPAIKQTTTQE
jgi:hypothetical protein